MPVRDERGYTLVELLVGMVISLVVLSAILAMVQVATGDQSRVSDHVVANQRGRPAMNRIIDALHSACISPGLAPVRENSSASSLIVYSKAGSAVSPVPNRHVFSFAEGELTEKVAIGSGAEPSKWSFGSETSPAQVVDGVSSAEIGEPPEAVPYFRYFAYEGGQVATTPLPTPLSKDDAANVVQVDIAFTVAPSAGAVGDPTALITLTDSATLRIEPASEDSAQVNLPCV
jgi:prepilin-type N-terminal cleavage/methylation domain-containing protein